MRIRLTQNGNGGIAIESPYHQPFIDGLKAAIDWRMRSWDAGSKRWNVSDLCAQELYDLCARLHIDIDDARGGSTAAAVLHSDMPADLAAAFGTLFLAESAPLLVAEAAWRALSRVYHPDNPEHGDDAKIREINAAIATVRRYLAAPSPGRDDIPF